MHDAAALGPGRLARVSLTDVPVKLRREAAARLIALAARRGGIEGALEAVALERAWREPSSRRYDVSAAAVLRVLGRIP